jgi:uncharacterized protein (TIGR02265 family)
MEQDKLEFQSSIEALFKVALADRITPELRARLKDAGLDLDRPLRPAYPAEAFARFLELAAEEVYPGQSSDAAFQALGRDFVSAFVEMPVGKAAFALMRLLGPVRALERLQRTVRAANNYVLVSTQKSGPQGVELTIYESPASPLFFLGVLEGGVQRATCLQDAHVEMASATRAGGRFRIRWAAPA